MTERPTNMLQVLARGGKSSTVINYFHFATLYFYLIKVLGVFESYSYFEEFSNKKYDQLLKYDAFMTDLSLIAKIVPLLILTLKLF